MTEGTIDVQCRRSSIFACFVLSISVCVSAPHLARAADGSPAVQTSGQKYYSSVLREIPKQLKDGDPAGQPAPGVPSLRLNVPGSSSPTAMATPLQIAPMAVVTSCTSTSGTLINANLESRSGAASTGWCDDYGLGYKSVVQTPVKYNTIGRLLVPTSTPVAQRNAALYQTVVLNQTTPKNVFVGAMLKGSQIVAGNSESGAFLNVKFQVNCSKNKTFCNRYPRGEVWCGTLPSVGTFTWRWVGLDSHTCGVGYRDSSSGNWVTVPIESVDVYGQLANATGTAFFDLFQVLQFSAGRGAVTFMFDDGYKSVINTALPILSGYGYVGSSAAISGEIGNSSSVTGQDLKTLQNAGWDIESHSITHPSMPSLSVAAAKTELLNSKSALQSYGVTIDSFIWPYGDYNQEVIGLAQTLGSPKPLYKSTRTVEFDDNAYGTNPYLIKVLEIDRPTTLAQVKSWIKELKDNPACTSACTGRWGVFLLHDLRTSPREYDTTPDFLRSVAAEVKKSGLDVINYRTGYQRFANVPMP